MTRASALGCLVLGTCLSLVGCSDGRSAAGGSGRQQVSQQGSEGTGQLTGRAKGLRDAERDRDRGILKLKEYPPLPYSLTDIQYIRLLKKRCGVEHEVLSGSGNDQDLRAEVQAYNSVMTAAIRQQYGADILAQLHQEAEKR